MTIDTPPAATLSSAHRRSAPRQVGKSAKHDHIWDMAEACLTQTAAALHETLAVNSTELSHAVSLVRESHGKGKPADLFETIAKIQGHTEEHLGSVILEFGNKVAAALLIYHPLIPFAHKLLAPTAFYDSFEQIHKIARVLLCPVTYAEDHHVIGIASTNPVASAILTEEIRSTVFKRFKIRPFVTATCLDYESWTILTRKHFN